MVRRLGVLLCLARFAVQDKSLMLLTQGLGRQPFHGHVVMLVNEFTNSAGEMAAQFAKDTKLATLVGHEWPNHGQEHWNRVCRPSKLTLDCHITSVVLFHDAVMLIFSRSVFQQKVFCVSIK
jgi:hypothetical protein